MFRGNRLVYRAVRKFELDSNPTSLLPTNGYWRNSALKSRFYTSIQTKFTTEGEKNIFDKLLKLNPTSLSVSDISGGCGSMYSIEIQAEEFRGKPMVKQHRIVNEVLKDEIKGMHGLRISSSAPKNDS
ncbi:hypothetical protein BB558_004582 [Smittium angustum]|uniref:Uncharacterized protein n=1 Tax=Smittium angustum TaxID=133377 RepID=A0A2U1IXP8_SMIAN|nr:hypothetical protein BB558_006444 [Smittium angustum]PVZ99403.1 hypothetical protein BB558_004582 [Smittium angustum]